MSRGLAELRPPRGSFRSQWARLTHVIPGKGYQFQESVAPWLNSVSLKDFRQHLRADAETQCRITPQPVKPGFLAGLARQFHLRAGTLTGAVEQALEDYAGGAQSLRVAHQPNFFASVNVAGQAAVCYNLAQLLSPSPVQIFFIVDYDVNTDRRYRHAVLPSLSSHMGFHSLSAPALHRKQEAFIFGEDKPDKAYLDHITQLIHAYSTHDLAIIRETHGYSKANRHGLLARQEALQEHITSAFENGRSFAEMNAIFLSRYINIELKLPTIFVQGSLALTRASDHIEYLWSRSGDYYAACRSAAAALEDIEVIVSRSLVPSPDLAPFWMKCDRDFARVAMYWTNRSHRSASGICARCGSGVTITSKSVAKRSADPSQPALIPRVVWDDLLDGFAWGYLGGCSYRGGIEHYMFAAAVASRMGLQPLPEFISECMNTLGPTSEFEEAAQLMAKKQGPLQERTGGRPAVQVARSGRASAVHSILWKPDLNVSDLALAFVGHGSKRQSVS